MIINIALGFVLGVIILAVMAAVIWFLSVTITKHRELSDNYNDIDKWFHKDRLGRRD